MIQAHSGLFLRDTIWKLLASFAKETCPVSSRYSPSCCQRKRWRGAHLACIEQFPSKAVQRIPSRFNPSNYERPVYYAEVLKADHAVDRVAIPRWTRLVLTSTVLGYRLSR